MMNFDKEYLKDVLSTQAYHVANKRINELVDEPTKPLDFLSYYEHCSYSDDILWEVDKHLNAINLEYPDDDFMELLNPAMEESEKYIFRYLQIVFYVGLYAENIDLFTREEQCSWNARIISLFDGFPMFFCTPADEYLHMQLDEKNFEEAEKDPSFWKGRFTFVFEDNPEVHNLEEFDLRFWLQLKNFAEEYYALYEELIACVRERKGVYYVQV